MRERIPEWTRKKSARETMTYRAEAERILRKPELATFKGMREQGWRQVGRIKTERGESIGWGFVKYSGYTLIWLSEGAKAVRGIRVSPSEEEELERILYLALGGLAIAVFGMTFLGLKFFVVNAQTKDLVLMAAAHDLSSPLAAMRGLMETDIGEAKRAAERMLLIVGNLRSFICGGRTAMVRCEAFSVVEVVGEAYAVWAEEFREETSGEVAMVTERQDYVVWADRTLTVQILWNLLGNALKYAAPLGPVKFRLSSDAKFVHISLLDWGKGMSKQELRRAFGRYYRAKNALESGRSGLGLGLCVAREFATIMHGSLTVQSNHPHGTIFTLSLPLDIHTAKYV